MGREIRCVPPKWEHPKKEDGNYQPMFDIPYKEAAEAWLQRLEEWEAGKNPLRKKYNIRYFWDYEEPPHDDEYYRPEFTEPATWYQVYETVSEGTPVTPPFATKEELIEYLVANGDFWDQSRGHGGRSRKAATAFVMAGWAPSGMVVKGKVLDGIDSCVETVKL